MANNLPSLFKERIVHILPEGMDLQQVFSPKPWKCFRVNTLKAGIDAIKADLGAMAIDWDPVSWCPSVFLVKQEQAKAILASDLVKQGLIYAQGLESILSVEVLDPHPNERILDLCAAPGSKTSQIAARMNNEGELVANEPVQARFFRLKAVLEITGAKARLSRQDGRYLRSLDLFDRVLVDAPCSSEGRFIEQEPKSYAYWSLRKIHEMAHKQKGLLLNASRLVKPGGILVYSTCTFAPEENEKVLEWFLGKAAGSFEEEAIRVPGLKPYSLSDGLKGGFRVLPDERMEGFFLAKLRRRVDA